MAIAIASACSPPPELSNPCNLELEAGLSSSQALAFEDPVPTNCPLTGCGTNSPVIAGVYFDRLHYLKSDESGFEPNLQGVHIVSISSPAGDEMALELVDDKDESAQPSNNGDRLRGVLAKGVVVPPLSMIGTQITVSVPTPDGRKNYVIALDNISRNRFWVGLDDDLMFTYTFRYVPQVTDNGQKERVPLCSNPDNDPNKLDAVVFNGDLYDAMTKKITTGEDTFGWFNIACVDSAVYKMHKIGHTSAAQERLEIETTLAQRHAMLNAWVAKVCPTGESFTAHGEEITLQESLGIFHHDAYSAVPASIEAIWNEHGAACLNVPRRIEDEPDICTKVTQTCMPPPCSAEMLASWTTYGHVLTGNR